MQAAAIAGVDASSQWCRLSFGAAGGVGMLAAGLLGGPGIGFLQDQNASTKLRESNAAAAAKVLSDAGFQVSTATVDVSSRESVHALVETATALGSITGVIHAAGVSPTQASPATILKVDLYGTALVLEEFGTVIARGGAGVGA